MLTWLAWCHAWVHGIVAWAQVAGAQAQRGWRIVSEVNERLLNSLEVLSRSWVLQSLTELKLLLSWSCEALASLLGAGEAA